MPRSRRPSTSGTTDRPERKPGAFDALAKLRGTLGSHRSRKNSKSAVRKPAPGESLTEPEGNPPAALGSNPLPNDDLELFHEIVGEVRPLTRAGGRAEIEAPKPAPVPRPRASEVEDFEPAAPPRRREPKSDFELFRAAIGDVTPLRADEHAELGVAPHSPYPLHSRDWKTGDEHPEVLLPPETDKADPVALFRHAARGAQPVNARNRAELDAPRPPPEPRQRREDEQAALRESLEAPLSLDDRLEMGEEAAFLRPGLPRRVLSDLRRGRWVLQGEVDLHGYNRDEAREALGQFLSASLQQGRRCVRVIHGKGLGSPGKVSILKQLSRGWLAQREEILAFCQAGRHEGGSGALLVLLRPGNPATRD